MNSRRNKNGRFVKNKRTRLRIIITIGKKAFNMFFTLISHFTFGGQRYHFHRSFFSTVANYFSMDVYVFMVLELFHKFASFLQRLLKGIRIGPSEVHRVCFWVIVVKSVSPCDKKTLPVFTCVPLDGSSASSPFHTVGSYSVNWS